MKPDATFLEENVNSYRTFLDRKALVNLEIISRLREETEEEVFASIVNNYFRTLPQKISRQFLLVKRLQIKSSGITDGLPFIQLKSGHIFYGLPQSASHYKIYDAMRGCLPKNLNRGCLLLAKDIVSRYQNVKLTQLIKKDMTVVMEVGAFHGLKAIRLSEFTDGKIIAIEIMPVNFNILKRNIEENGLANRIEIVQAGAWNCTEIKKIATNGYQKNAVAPINNREWSKTPSHSVCLEPLDDIIDRLNLKKIDLLNIQVNGAEYEAIEGLKKYINRAGLLCIALSYTRNDGPSLPKCEELLIQMGCEVIKKTKRGLVAIPSERVHEYAWIKEKKKRKK